MAIDPPAETMTEKAVRDRLLRHYSPHDALIAFNLRGIGPYDHEMDVVRILKSGWAYEFEIKITAADIRADAKKAAKYAELECGCRAIAYRPMYGEHTWPDELLIAKANPVEGQIGDFYVHRPASLREWPLVCARVQRPVKQFWIVVPTPELAEIAKENIPDFAGVAVCRDRFYFQEVRIAKDLPNARKLTDAERRHVLERMYHRYWDLYHNRGGVGRK